MLDEQIYSVDGTILQQTYNTSKLVGKLLVASNLSKEKMDDILSNNKELTVSEDSCVLKACAMLLQAKQNNEKVFIAGDYDCDGVCATSIMKETLDILGVKNGYYIPDRFKEGYGMNVKTVEMAINKGYTLFITVDNGVKCNEAIDFIHEHGGKCIVTDHHEIEGEVHSDVLVHPTLMEERYQYLCGAGVALEISMNLIGRNDGLLALASVASIGDVMPLYKETRVIVKNGFECIQNNALPSLTAMLYKASEINVETVGFQIVPKINAVGRMADKVNVNTLIPYLLSKNMRVIQSYVVQLNKVNEMRKGLSKKMCEEALTMIDENDGFPIVYDPSFHQGLCGLAAGRIASDLKKPTLVFSCSDGLYKGSGRSVEGFNMFEFLCEDFDEFEAFGGHAFACGMSIKEENFASFVNHVKDKFASVEIKQDADPKKAILIDANDVNLFEVKQLATLEPYPKDMVEPLFAIKDVTTTAKLEYPKVVKYRFDNEDGGFDGVLFAYRKVEAIDHPSVIFGNLSINTWKNVQKCQIILNDLR